MNRRDFIGSLGAVSVVAALPVAGLPVLAGDGIHDDTRALQALIDGKPVKRLDGGKIIPISGVMTNIPPGKYIVSETLYISDASSFTMHNSEIYGCNQKTILDFGVRSKNAKPCRLENIFVHSKKKHVYDL